MIGLGLDLCEIARIGTAMEKGEGFLARYFTPEERAYLAQRGKSAAQSAAAMFAAKEAFLKALGVGLSGGIAMVWPLRSMFVDSHRKARTPFLPMVANSARSVTSPSMGV